MFDILRDMEHKQTELHKKLAAILIEHHSEDGTVRVKVDGNKQIRDVVIDKAHLDGTSAGLLEDLLVMTLNEALNQADTRALEEMQNQMGEYLPDFGGLDSPFTA